MTLIPSIDVLLRLLRINVIFLSRSPSSLLPSRGPGKSVSLSGAICCQAYDGRPSPRGHRLNSRLQLRQQKRLGTSHSRLPLKKAYLVVRVGVFPPVNRADWTLRGVRIGWRNRSKSCRGDDKETPRQDIYLLRVGMSHEMWESVLHLRALLGFVFVELHG